MDHTEPAIKFVLHAWFLLPAVALALLGNAVAFADEPPAPGRPPQPVTYVFGEEVSAEQREQLRELVERARTLVDPVLGASAESFTVLAYADRDRLVDAYLNWHALSPNERAVVRARWENDHTAETSYGSIFLDLSRFRLSRAPDDTWVWLQIVVHEYIHVVQNELVGPPGLIREPDIKAAPFGGPRWLVEGSAVYITRSVLGRGVMVAGDAPVALQTLETWSGMAAAGRDRGYGLSLAAVALLMDGSGPPSLAKFWRAIGWGTSWQKAFESAFGRGIEEFYAEFEALRRS